MTTQDTYAGRHRASVTSRTYWPAPTISEPDEEDLMDMVDEGTADATDGCAVEPDGECSHGHPSWLLYWELI